jgi:hypothetical protein
MSFTRDIVRKVAESLKLIRSRVKPKHPSHQGVKSREPKIVPLHDPRITKGQLKKLMAKAESAKHPAR